MYTEKVMQHFKDPKNVGVIENADGEGEVGNASCGDIMKIFIKVEDNKIKDIKFQTYGCAAAIASTDMLCDLVKGKALEDALKITKQDVADALEGLPKIKMHCSNLAADALKKAIEDFREK